MKLDLEAIRGRCEALDEQRGKMAWTLEGPNYCELFSVYDSDGYLVSRGGIKEQQDFIACARTDIPALLVEVRRLQRELHDEQVRRDEWERMYNQAIAGTEIERSRAEVEKMQAEAARLRVEEAEPYNLRLYRDLWKDYGQIFRRLCMERR